MVEIREVNGEYVGVVRALLVAADLQDSVCGKCPGDRKGQQIVGMEIFRHMRRDGDEWSGGEILDPENGRAYRARMRLVEGGRKLVVRGYIGLPLFGRSQTWVRRTERDGTGTGSAEARPLFRRRRFGDRHRPAARAVASTIRETNVSMVSCSCRRGRAKRRSSG